MTASYQLSRCRRKCGRSSISTCCRCSRLRRLRRWRWRPAIGNKTPAGHVGSTRCSLGFSWSPLPSNERGAASREEIKRRANCTKRSRKSSRSARPDSRTETAVIRRHGNKAKGAEETQCIHIPTSSPESDNNGDFNCGPGTTSAVRRRNCKRAGALCFMQPARVPLLARCCICIRLSSCSAGVVFFVVSIPLSTRAHTWKQLAVHGRTKKVK